MGMDVSDGSVRITGMEQNGNVNEQYEMMNDESSWTEFMKRYATTIADFAMQVSASGK